MIIRKAKMKPEVTKDELTEIEIKILQNLDYGFSTAILLKTLCQKTGIRDERKVRLAIESLRGKLWPILSGDTGYFICNNKEERDSFYAYHRKELITRYHMVKRVLKACDEKLDKAVQIKMI
jgi:hypothetical protein